MTRRALAVCCAPQVLVALDFALLAVAAPGAQDDLGLSDGAARWLFSAYSLAFGCLLLPAGRLADAAGRGVLLRAGLALFAGAAAAAALAPNGAVLIAARVAGGAGAAAMTPAALALITASTREGAERRAAMSAYGAAIAAGFVAGALAGGALSTLTSWRPLLAAEAVLAAATLAFAAALPDAAATTRGATRRRRRAAATTRGATSRPRRAAATTRRPRRATMADAAGRSRFDTSGALLGAGAVTLALAPLPAAWRVLAAGCAWAFWRRELRTADPLLPLDVLGRRAVLACAAGAAVTATGVAATVLLTVQLQDVHGFSPLEAGAVLAVFGSTAPPGAWLVRRTEPGAVSRLGLLVQGAALVAVAAALARGATAALLVAVAAFGLGHIAANAGVAQLALGGIPCPRQGAVGATLGTSQYLGAAAGPLVFGAAGGELGIAAAGCAAAAACVLTPSARREPLAAR